MKSEIRNVNNPKYIDCIHDDRSALEKCGGDICPAMCFPPEVNFFSFFIHPDTYKYTFTWPVWLIDEVVYPEVYSGETRTTSRVFFGVR